MRIVRLLACALVAAAVGFSAQAHNLAYALADVRLAADGAARIEIRAHIPALLMGQPQGHLADDVLPSFLALPDTELAARESQAAAALTANLSLRADGRLVDAIAVAFPAPAVLRTDAAVPRSSPRPSSPLVLTTRLPPGTRTVDLALPQEFGPAVVAVTWPDGRRVTQGVGPGERTGPIRLAGPSPWRDGAAAFARFVALGFSHILPLGLDHVLFIVALAIGAPRLGRLIRLATLFTLAHSVTLALAAFDIVRAPAAIVEPAIALSIAVVAVMNLIPRPEGPRREQAPLIVAFGLLHGLGFAGALRALGLPRGQETLALAGFNVGVELGQVAVILAVLAAVGWWRSRPFYATRIAAPVSLAVAAIGLFWTIQRILQF